MASSAVANNRMSVDAAFALAHSLGFDLTIGSGIDQDTGLHVFDAWIAISSAMNHLAEVVDMPTAADAAFTAIDRAIALRRAGYMEAPLPGDEPSSLMLEPPAALCA